MSEITLTIKSLPTLNIWVLLKDNRRIEYSTLQELLEAVERSRKLEGKQ